MLIIIIIMNNTVGTQNDFHIHIELQIIEKYSCTCEKLTVYENELKT